MEVLVLAVVSAAPLVPALPVVIPAETMPVVGITTKVVSLAFLHAICVERLFKHRR